MSKIRPLHERVLVKRLEGEGVSKGGIIIPDSAQEKPAEGEVVAVGTGTRTSEGHLIPLDVKVGDKVLFIKYPSYYEVSVDGETFIILREEDILAVAE